MRVGAITFVFLSIAFCNLYQSLKPVQANYKKTQLSVTDLDNQLNTLRNDYKALRTSTYGNDYQRNPTARPVPHVASTISELAKDMKKLRKSMMKEQEVPDGSSPQEMMLFQQLLSGLKRTSRKNEAEPAMHEANQMELEAMQRLTDQINNISNGLESPEENILHQQSHANSRMLHRMNHVLEAMSDEMETEKQMHYEDMLTTLMHQHLADPDYHDPLHDHLLAHHLAKQHKQNEFTDHLTHHMLYHDLDRSVDRDGDYSNAIGAVLGSQLNARNNNLAGINRAALMNTARQNEQNDKAATQQFAQQLGQRTNNQFQVAKPVTTQTTTPVQA